MEEASDTAKCFIGLAANDAPLKSSLSRCRHPSGQSDDFASTDPFQNHPTDESQHTASDQETAAMTPSMNLNSATQVLDSENDPNLSEENLVPTDENLTEKNPAFSEKTNMENMILIDHGQNEPPNYHSVQSQIEQNQPPSSNTTSPVSSDIHRHPTGEQSTKTVSNPEQKSSLDEATEINHADEQSSFEHVNQTKSSDPNDEEGKQLDFPSICNESPFICANLDRFPELNFTLGSPNIADAINSVGFTSPLQLPGALTPSVLQSIAELPNSTGHMHEPGTHQLSTSGLIGVIAENFTNGLANLNKQDIQIPTDSNNHKEDTDHCIMDNGVYQASEIVPSQAVSSTDHQAEASDSLRQLFGPSLPELPEMHSLDFTSHDHTSQINLDTYSELPCPDGPFTPRMTSTPEKYWRPPSCSANRVIPHYNIQGNTESYRFAQPAEGINVEGIHDMNTIDRETDLSFGDNGQQQPMYAKNVNVVASNYISGTPTKSQCSQASRYLSGGSYSIPQKPNDIQITNQSQAQPLFNPQSLVSQPESRPVFTNMNPLPLSQLQSQLQHGIMATGAAQHTHHQSAKNMGMPVYSSQPVFPPPNVKVPGYPVGYYGSYIESGVTPIQLPGVQQYHHGKEPITIMAHQYTHQPAMLHPSQLPVQTSSTQSNSIIYNSGSVSPGDELRHFINTFPYADSASYSPHMFLSGGRAVATHGSNDIHDIPDSLDDSFNDPDDEEDFINYTFYKDTDQNPQYAVDMSKRPESLQDAISMYIDYLIWENEMKTKISRCTILNVGYDFSAEEYFREILIKPIPFPTTKFRGWLKGFHVDIEITDPEGNVMAETVFGSDGQEIDANNNSAKKPKQKKPTENCSALVSSGTTVVEQQQFFEPSCIVNEVQRRFSSYARRSNRGRGRGRGRACSRGRGRGRSMNSITSGTVIGYGKNGQPFVYKAITPSEDDLQLVSSNNEIVDHIPVMTKSITAHSQIVHTREGQVKRHVHFADGIPTQENDLHKKTIMVGSHPDFTKSVVSCPSGMRPVPVLSSTSMTEPNQNLSNSCNTVKPDQALSSNSGESRCSETDAASSVIYMEQHPRTTGGQEPLSLQSLQDLAASGRLVVKAVMDQACQTDDIESDEDIQPNNPTEFNQLPMSSKESDEELQNSTAVPELSTDTMKPNEENVSVVCEPSPPKEIKQSSSSSQLSSAAAESSTTENNMVNEPDLEHQNPVIPCTKIEPGSSDITEGFTQNNADDNPENNTDSESLNAPADEMKEEGIPENANSIDSPIQVHGKLKRGRGRPRKHPIITATEDLNSSSKSVHSADNSPSIISSAKKDETSGSQKSKPSKRKRTSSNKTIPSKKDLSGGSKRRCFIADSP